MIGSLSDTDVNSVSIVIKSIANLLAFSESAFTFISGDHMVGPVMVSPVTTNDAAYL